MATATAHHSKFCKQKCFQKYPNGGQVCHIPNMRHVFVGITSQGRQTQPEAKTLIFIAYIYYSYIHP